MLRSSLCLQCSLQWLLGLCLGLDKLIVLGTLLEWACLSLRVTWAIDKVVHQLLPIPMLGSQPESCCGIFNRYACLIRSRVFSPFRQPLDLLKTCVKNCTTGPKIEGAFITPSTPVLSFGENGNDYLSGGGSCTHLMLSTAHVSFCPSNCAMWSIGSNRWDFSTFGAKLPGL